MPLSVEDSNGKYITDLMGVQVSPERTFANVMLEMLGDTLSLAAHGRRIAL
jgi:hypothetical protein